MKTLVIVVLVFAIAVAGCKKSADQADRGSAAQTSPAQPSKPAPTAEVDHVEVLARHRPVAGKEDLAADPVVVHFDRFAITKASFDPKHLEGGTATIELDMTSIKTGSEERDRDLQGPDYIDVGQFATATVDVANVKQQTANTYTADATVAFRGVTKTYSVTFAVIATTASSVRVKGELAFSRLDFAVGIDPAKDPTERIDTPLLIEWVLTFTR